MKWLLKRFVILLPALFAAGGVSLAVEQPQKFAISNFSGGLNTNYDSLTIADNESADALNVYFDKDNAGMAREGFAVCGSSKQYSFDSAWSYRDNTNLAWLIVRSSDTIMAASTGCNFTVKVTTTSTNDIVNAVNAFGYIWFVDQSQGVYYWNGTSTTYVVGSPHGSLIQEFRNRLWVSGLAVPNGNLLYGSKYLDGTTWTAGTLATDPVILTIGLNDSYDVITAIFSGFNDSMQIFKNRSIHALYGADQSDFILRILNKEVGCADNRSIQPYMGGLVFASNRGIEAFDGANVVTPPISDKIQNKVQGAVASSFNQRSITHTSQSDFQAGSIVPTASLSTTISVGDVVPSSFSTTENSAASGWSSGTQSNMAVGTSSISLSVNNVGNITNPDFESSFSGNWTASCSTAGCWKQSSAGNSLNCGVINPQTGSSVAGPINVGWGTTGIPTVYFEAIDLSSNLLQQQSMTPLGNICSWVQTSLTPSASNVGKRVKFRLHRNDSAGDFYLTTTDSYIWGGAISFYFNSGCTGDGNCAINIDYVFIDNVTLGSSTITSGSFTSQVFDTGVASNTYQITDFSYTVNSSTPTFGLLTSTATTGPWAQILTSTGINAGGQRYAKYVSTIAVISSGNALTSIANVTVIAKSTGTFYSSVVNAPSLNSWGSLTVNKSDNGGTHSFFMRRSTDSFTVLSATPAWSAQTANASISIATGTYFQVRDDFLITMATHTPTLNDFSVSWNEGSRRPPMASITKEKRYYLSLTTATSSSQNDSTLVLSPGPIWSIWDIKAGAFVTHNGSFYHTNNQSNGYVYTDFSGNDDAGTAMNTFIKTKDFALGDITMDKEFDSFYLTADADTTEGSATSYTINKSTTSFSLDSISLSENTGLNILKLPFPIQSSNPNFGKTISFRFSPTLGTRPWKIFGGVLLYRPIMTQ